MTANIPAIVALCAGSGFLIVWLVFPAKAAQAPVDAEEPPGPQPVSTGSRPRWCDILLLEPDASPAAIRQAYARLMKGLHPDVAGPDANTSRQCALVQEAYQQAMQDRCARP